MGQTSRSARDVHVPHARTGVDGCLPHALSMGASYLDLEAVISQPDMRRQTSLGACVRQIVADVGEENSPRRQLFRGGDGTVYGRMRGVWLVAQSIQKEHIQAPQLCERGIRDLAVIRKISRIAKPESIDRRLAMQEGDGRELDAEQIDGGAVQHVGFQLRHGGLLFLTVEHVAERAMNGGHRSLRRVDGDGRALVEVERPYVIQAHDVVGMLVREQDRVEALEARSQRLRAEVRGGVDQHVMAAVAHQDGGAQALIARIGGCTHIAMAADSWHTRTGAGAEHGDLDGATGHSGFLAVCLRGLRRRLSFGCLSFFRVVGRLHETEAQQGQRVFKQPLFFEAEIAAGLFLEHGHQIDGVARQIEIGRRLVFRTETHQSQLHFSLQAQGFGKEFKGGRGQGEGPTFLLSAGVGIYVDHLVIILQRAGDWQAANFPRWGKMDEHPDPLCNNMICSSSVPARPASVRPSKGPSPANASHWLKGAKLVGGTCINSGTIPSKTMREAVLHLSGFEYQGIYGVSYRVKEKITMADLGFRVQHVIKTETDITQAQLSRNGIEVIYGTARFVDATHIRVENSRGVSEYEAGIIIIGTGTKPAVSAKVPLNGRTIINSDQILQMPDIPKILIVVGGGVIGVEYTCMFAALGVRVILVEKRPRLLEFADAEIIEALSYHLRDHRVTMRLNEEVESVEDTPTGVVANLMSKKKISGDALLYAVGRQGNVEELNLPAAGLEADNRGRIPVNACYHTKQPNIYAVGDVIGFPSLASVSMEQGRIAAATALGIPVHSNPGDLSVRDLYDSGDIVHRQDRGAIDR